jgi:hypothetical protein
MSGRQRLKQSRSRDRCAGVESQFAAHRNALVANASSPVAKLPFSVRFFATAKMCSQSVGTGVERRPTFLTRSGRSGLAMNSRPKAKASAAVAPMTDPMMTHPMSTHPMSTSTSPAPVARAPIRGDRPIGICPAPAKLRQRGTCHQEGMPLDRHHQRPTNCGSRRSAMALTPSLKSSV